MRRQRHEVLSLVLQQLGDGALVLVDGMRSHFGDVREPLLELGVAAHGSRWPSRQAG
jgi:hypothetical protein